MLLHLYCGRVPRFSVSMIHVGHCSVYRMSGNTIGIQPGTMPADLQETRAENGEVVSFERLALCLEWRD